MPKVRSLIRLQDEEVLATWTEELHPLEQMAIGYFQFSGAAQSGQLGEYWTLMAVASGIRIAESEWELSAAIDSMIKAAGKIALGGGGMVAGMIPGA